MKNGDTFNKKTTILAYHYHIDLLIMDHIDRLTFDHIESADLDHINELNQTIGRVPGVVGNLNQHLDSPEQVRLNQLGIRPAWII